MARRRSSKRRRGGPRQTPSRSPRGSKLAGPALVALAVVVLVSLVAWWLAPAPTVRPLKRWWSERQGLARVEGHAEVILAAARESGVDPCLLAGVMMVESRGHVDALSPAGALGLFQLMLPTAVEQAGLLGVARPTERTLLSDALLNARLGARYLAWLLARFQGEEERALVAYNAGPGRLKRWTEEAGSYAAWRDARERAGDSEVLAYARDVLQYRRRFADRGAIAPTAASPVPEASSAAESEAPAPVLVGPPAPTLPPRER